MHKFLQISFSLFIVLAFCQCKSTKVRNHHGTSPKADSVVTSAAVWNKCQSQKIDFQTISLGGKMFIDAPSEGLAQMTVNYRINMKRDSAIWIKMTLFGIEGGRMLITPEKVQILDRQNNRAIIKSLADFKKQFGIEAEFSALQDILIGNPANILPLQALTLQDVKANPLVLEGKQKDYNFAYFIDNQNFKLNKITFRQDTMTQAAAINYSNFQPFDKYQLANEVSLEIPLKKGKVSGNLSHTKMELNPAEITFAFSIPENYTIEK